jgi:hypothetical protein
MNTEIRALFVGINYKSFLNHGDSTLLKLRQSRLKVVGSWEDNPELVVCVDVDQSALRLARKARRKNVRTVLIQSEPMVVVPLNGHPKALKTFDTVFQIGRPNSRPLLPWPQHSFENPVNGKKVNSGQAVLIQSRKYSFVKGQLYSLRVQLAAKDKRVIVVGHGWMEPLHRTLARLLVEFLRALMAGVQIDMKTLSTGFQKPLNLLGPAESKRVAMNDFTVAVVIENSQEYMSEKLFDALVGGSIPVYVGPDLENFEIPSALYVKSEASIDSVQQGISEALDMDYVSWQQQVWDFLRREETIELWHSTNAQLRILNWVSENLK